MNFYVGALRFLPPVLLKLGLACLAFNRRGHDILSTRNSRVPEGGAFQLAREGIEDNRSAARWIAERDSRRSDHRPQQRRHARRSARCDHPQTPALVTAIGAPGRQNIMVAPARAGSCDRERPRFTDSSTNAGVWG